MHNYFLHKLFLNVFQLKIISFVIIIILVGVLGLSFRRTELPLWMAGIIWLIVDKIGKSKDDKINTTPIYAMLINILALQVP